MSRATASIPRASITFIPRVLTRNVTCLFNEGTSAYYERVSTITKNAGGLSKTDGPPRFVLQLIHFPYTDLSEQSLGLPKAPLLRYFCAHSDG